MGEKKSDFTACPPRCKYAGVAGGWLCCDYWIIEDKLRGCEGGKNCEKYTKIDNRVKKSPKRRDYPEKLSFSADKARELLAQGLSDRAVAEQLGVKKGLLKRWRIRHGIEENVCNEPRVRRLCFDPDEARRLYDEGHIDREIAEALGVAPQTINKWRLKAGLPSKFLEKQNEKHKIGAGG